ncbi:MAG: hypothetical protein JNL80_17010 [Phycisphaerae bacterium]|nr:hypothetical protein [Phycisphaerae bacterium]
MNDNGVDPVQRFTMELVVGELSSPQVPSEPAACEWTILYRGGAVTAPSTESPVQERRYRLLVRDAAKGEFAIDERNGIVIEARLLNGALYSHFVVQGTRITTREKLEGVGTKDERIEVEMLVTRDELAVVSGGVESVPEVRSWVPRSIQRATLRRSPMKSPDPAR